MEKQDGFSLTEVLISLGLMATTSLGLIKQYEHISQLFYQLQSDSQSIAEQANNFEFNLFTKHQTKRASEERFAN